MNKLKYIAIAFISLFFILFALVQHSSNSTYNVLQVYSPFEVAVDINNNGVVDDNEIVKILEGYQYISKESVPNNSIAQNLSLSLDIQYALAYLTEKFANDVLLDKKVSVRNSKFGKTIFIANEDYADVLLKSGYVFKDNQPISKELFNKRITAINKYDYKIYNAKSDKYHCLDCKYGLKAHNYVILPKSQLPKGAKPCKFCMNSALKEHVHKNVMPKDYFKKLTICPPLVYSCGSIKVFLTDFTTKLKPDRNGNTSVCNELVKQINCAKSTIDIAIYGYDRVPKIEQALKCALARGVRIRLVYDIDSNDSNIYAHTKEFAQLIKNARCDSAPKTYPNPVMYTNSIMHDKFYVFDNSLVITGSANLSYTDMSGYNSNSVILINSKKIAEIYTKEFEQMYNGQFHKLKNTIPEKQNIIIGNDKLSIYFSPTDSAINTALIPLIDKSTKYIYMPVFLLTDAKLASALINARKRGVDVKVIVDATNAKSKYSKHRLLRQNNIMVKTENYAGKLHSKSIVVDDKYTVIGSMNFSASGNNKNDENLIVIENTGIAIFYRTFFNYLWSKISDYWLTHDVSAESIHSIGSCSDGIDNDYDGYTDLQDEGCKALLKKN